MPLSTSTHSIGRPASGAVRTASARRLPFTGLTKDPPTGRTTSVSHASIVLMPGGGRGGAAAGRGAGWFFRTTGFVGTGTGWMNAVMVSVTFRACGAPDATDAFAVLPMSRTSRSRTTPAASRPAGVRFHSFSVTRLPFALTLFADPRETTRPWAARSFAPFRIVWLVAWPGAISRRSCAAVATFTTPSAVRIIVRVFSVDPNGHTFVPPTVTPYPSPRTRPPSGRKAGARPAAPNLITTPTTPY